MGKGVGKSLVKKLPVIGLIAGLGFGLKRALGGDFSGAAMEVASGAASLIPGVGTAASVAIDAALIGKDVVGAKKANASDEATKIYSQIGETSSSASASLAAGEEIDPKIKTAIIQGLAKSSTSLGAKGARSTLQAQIDSVRAGVGSQSDLDMFIKRALVSATRKSGKVSESDLKGVESLFAEERIGQLKAESSPTETITGKKVETKKLNVSDRASDLKGVESLYSEERTDQLKAKSSPTETMTGQTSDPISDIVKNLSPEQKAQIAQGAKVSSVITGDQREMIMDKMARSSSSQARQGALKKFNRIAKLQLKKAADVTPSPSTPLDNIGSIPSSDGAQLTMAQKENAELKGESGKAIAAPIIAPSNINNSQSSVSNVTVAAPPHIDKTQSIFGTTQLSY